MKKFTLFVSMAAVAAIGFAQAPQETEDMIIYNPVGTHFQMQATEDYFAYNGGETEFTSGNRIIFDVVIDEAAGDVYIKNIFCDEITNAYVKGKKEGNKITFSFPQLYEIYASSVSGIEYYYHADRLKKYVNYMGELEYFIPKDEDNFITFEVQADGSWTCTELDQEIPSDGYPNVIFGLDIVEWSAGTLLEPMFGTAGFCNFKAEPFNMETLALPEGLTPERWSMTADSGSRFLNVAIDGNKIYLGNWNTMFPDSYVEGTIEGDKVIIPSDQYLGRDERKMRYVSLMAAPVVVGKNPATGAKTYEFGNLINGNIELNYDAENKTLSADGIALIINGDTNKVFATAFYANPKIASTNQAPAQPQTPTVEYKEPYTSFMGYGMVVIDIPVLDVNGNLLDADKMYYNMYIDGDELYAFYNDEYTCIPNDMSPLVNVPYYYHDGYDFIVEGTTHTIYTYASSTKWGCRSVYKDGDTVLTSDIAIGVAAGVESIEAGNEVSAEYYDLMGRKVANPSNGIFIRKSVMDNGAVKATKNVLR